MALTSAVEKSVGIPIGCPAVVEMEHDGMHGGGSSYEME